MTGTRWPDNCPLDQIPTAERTAVFDDRTARGVPTEGRPDREPPTAPSETSRAQAASARGASDSAPQAAQRPNKRQQAKARTRARVIAAATALFEAGGYASATIRDIAAGAGMSTGAVFANFRDKAELWTACFGGPPPSLQLADELAFALGQLRDCGGVLSWDATGFRACLHTADFNPVAGGGAEWSARGDSPAAALRAAREAALAARATHAVRQPEAA